MEILTFDELENANGNVEFEGAYHGGAGVSFFVMNAERGRGPSLHTHDYPEVLITLEGQATLHTVLRATSRSGPGTSRSFRPASRTASRARATCRSAR